MEARKHIKRWIFIILWTSLTALNAQVVQPSSYGYLPLSVSGGGAVFLSGQTSYNQCNSPVEIRYLAFASETFGLDYTFYKTYDFSFRFGLRWEHVYENIYERVDKDQFSNAENDLIREFSWDWYEFLWKFPIGADYRLSRRVQLVFNLVPGFLYMPSFKAGSIIDISDPPHQIQIRWENTREKNYLFNVDVGMKWDFKGKYFRLQPYILYSHSFTNMYDYAFTVDGIINRPYQRVEGRLTQKGSAWLAGIHIYPFHVLKYYKEKHAKDFVEEPHRAYSDWSFSLGAKYVYGYAPLYTEWDLFVPSGWQYALGFKYQFYRAPSVRMQAGIRWEPDTQKIIVQQNGKTLYSDNFHIGEMFFLPLSLQHDFYKNFYIQPEIAPGVYWRHFDLIAFGNPDVTAALAFYNYPHLLLDMSVAVGKNFLWKNAKWSLAVKYNHSFHETWLANVIINGELKDNLELMQWNDYVGLELSFSPKKMKKK